MDECGSRKPNSSSTDGKSRHKVPRFLTVHPASAGSRLWQKEEDMDRYLIETPHAGPECLGLIKQLNAQGYLWNFDWG